MPDFQPVTSAKASNVAALVHTPNQIANAAGDLLRLRIGFIDTSNSYTVATPAGWTLAPYGSWPERQDDLMVYHFYKESSGGESFPSVTVTGGTVEMMLISQVVPDADFVSGPFGDTALAKNTNNSPHPSVTTTQNFSYVDYDQFMHRRNIGWNASNGTVNIEYVASGQTGGSSNKDCHGQVAIDYAATSGTTLAPPRTSQNEDRIITSVEILTNGLIIPTLLVDDEIGASVTGGSLANDNEFRDRQDASGYTAQGPIQNYNFSDSDINSVTNEIEIAQTGLLANEGYVVRYEVLTGTGDSALTDGNYYFVTRPSATGFGLSDANSNLASANDFYQDNTNGGGTQANISLNGDGSGTYRLRDCGIAVSRNGSATFRYPAGGSGATTDFSGNWTGACVGFDVCLGFHRKWATSVDLTGKIIGITQRYGTGAFDWGLRGIRLMDTNNEWVDIPTYRGGNGTNNSLVFWIQPDGNFAGKEGYRFSGGTYDASLHDMIFVYYEQINTDRANGSQQLDGVPVEYRKPVVFGGTASDGLTMLSAAQTIQAKIDGNLAGGSGDQTQIRMPFDFGDGTLPLYVDENAKHILVPLIGGEGTDTASELRFHVTDFEIGLRPDATGSFSLRNSTIADTNRNLVERHVIPVSAEAKFDGRLFINTTPILDADVTYLRPNFIGCDQINDNNAVIRNGSFDVSSAVGANNGLVTWGAGTDIQASDFQLAAGVTAGHAIRDDRTNVTIPLPSLTFTGFGPNGSATAAFYFPATTGTITLQPSGNGTANPTYRTGGATVVIESGATLTITNVPSGGVLAINDNDDTPDKVADMGTLLQETDPTTGVNITYTHTKGGDDIFITFLHPDYEEVNISFDLLGVDQTFNLANVLTLETNDGT